MDIFDWFPESLLTVTHMPASNLKPRKVELSTKCRAFYRSAARRRSVGVDEKIDRRDGDLKTYWTEPLHCSAPMGIELFGSPGEPF
jgi:hypothetical protein